MQLPPAFMRDTGQRQNIARAAALPRVALSGRYRVLVCAQLIIGDRGYGTSEAIQIAKHVHCVRKIYNAEPT